MPITIKTNILSMFSKKTLLKNTSLYKNSINKLSSGNKYTDLSDGPSHKHKVWRS